MPTSASPPPHLPRGDVPDEPLMDGAIPAATLIIMRRGAHADEILMVRRSQTMAFAAGAAVFPGGRIEPDDHQVAAAHGLDASSLWAAARVAAIREALEETGLPLGWPGLDPADVPTVRAALLDGAPLSALLAQRGDRLALDALQPWARWCPNFKESRTFDTCFFIVAAPPDLIDRHQPSIDIAEHSHWFWTSARGALDAADKGAISVIFPTRRNLERLAQFDRFAEAHAHARAIPAWRITPWIDAGDGEARLCIPADAGYPVCSAPLATVRRG